MTCLLKCHSSAPQQLTEEWLEPAHWLHTNHHVGSSSGRNKVYFIDFDNQQWVLRHYYRGGFIAKFNRDSFLFLGNQRTRAIAEFDLLQAMRKLQLPVPQPIAARVVRKGLFYKNDILIERFNAKDLHGYLLANTIRKEEWQLLGRTIAEFHRHKVYHADLNIKNILFDGQQFYLIDFDRGEFKPSQGRWCQANLDRLLRSFRKELAKDSNLHWHESDWHSLVSGYQAFMSAK
ncbi:3-deoxy-D-manno-octulosonic acid kinase [Paraferrimonas haliotis]|uniref:3-deoxy-D-manno-octulosonic acid kinase n=1 Tax=Paraferrimonas haliotis TaxID=2013866 RepID=A0AA37TSN6_9GAMM|nr:3-deoxy-D-manno-octulosonic acid kinase [Paraferrimonas haliotis]GLS82165.1 3-deoxy-D-manno-octulosonic acid kinase [Paraferrimonas haliotis]